MDRRGEAAVLVTVVPRTLAGLVVAFRSGLIISHPQIARPMPTRTAATRRPVAQEGVGRPSGVLPDGPVGGCRLIAGRSRGPARPCTRRQSPSVCLSVRDGASRRFDSRIADYEVPAPAAVTRDGG